MIKESTLSHQDIIYFQIWVNRLMIQENWTWYRSNMYYVYARYIFCKKSAGISFVAFKNWPENRTATWLIQLLVMGKVIYPKYSKHWPYAVASIIDCGCSKMLNHGLNHGFFLSLFKLIPCLINWIVCVFPYLNFIF